MVDNTSTPYILWKCVHMADVLPAEKQVKSVLLGYI